MVARVLTLLVRVFSTVSNFANAFAEVAFVRAPGLNGEINNLPQKFVW